MVDSYSRLADSSAGGEGSNFSNLFPQGQGPLRQCIHEVPALLIRVMSRQTERDLTPTQSALWEGEKARPTHDDLGSGKVAIQEMADCAVSAGGCRLDKNACYVISVPPPCTQRMSVCARSGSDWIEGSILLNLTPVTRDWDADGGRSMYSENLICLVKWPRLPLYLARTAST